MSTLQAFFLGIMVCVIPSMLLLSVVLAALPRSGKMHNSSHTSRDPVASPGG
jgi:hypothetical protein